MSKRKCVIVDIDGVLANSEDEVKKHIKDDKDYSAFEKSYPKHKTHQWAIDLVKIFYKTMDIIIVTGRADRNRTRPDIEEWLYDNEIPFDGIMMREDKDYRPSSIIKKESLLILKEEYDVYMALEDHPDVNKMYDEEGVICLMPNNSGYLKDDKTTEV